MQAQWWEYDPEGDVLDVYFGEKRPVWTIELTPNIRLSIDRTAREVTRLTFLDYTVMAEATEWGPRSFPILGLAGLPPVERDLVIELLKSPPVDQWLDVSAVQTMPDSPFAVVHLAAQSTSLELLVPA